MSDTNKMNKDNKKTLDLGKDRETKGEKDLDLTKDMDVEKKSSKTISKDVGKKEPVNDKDTGEDKKALGKIEPKKVPANQGQSEDDAPKEKQPIFSFGGDGGGSDFEETDVDFMAPVAASHRRKPSSLANILLYAVVAFFIIILIWANIATLDEITRGEGRIIPSGQVKVVDHLEGGLVKDILVKEGQIVEKGQILLRIDSAVARSRYEEGLSLFYQTMTQLARLRAQIQGKEYKVPEEAQKNAPEIAQKSVELYNSAMERLQNEKEIAEQEVEQRQQELVEASSRVEQLTNRLALAEEELRLTEPLVKSGIAPKMDGIRIKRDISDTKGELASAKANVSRAEAALEQGKQRLEQVPVNFRNEDYREFREAEQRWAEVKDLTTTGLDRITRTDVRSPVRGTIKELLVNTIGSVVQPGEDLVAIVPLEDSLLVEAKVKPADVAFLRPGMKAIIKITAYDFSIYGGMDAELIDISADSIEEKDGNQQEEFFRIRLRTDKNHLGTKEKPFPISPGLTAQVDILTGKKTVWHYIMKPILKAKQKALTER